MTSTAGSCSSAWATRPPQNVPRPVMSTRPPTMPSSAEPHRAAFAQHLVQRLLDLFADRLGLVHDFAARVARLVRRDVERDRIEHLQPELRREGQDATEQWA